MPHPLTGLLRNGAQRLIEAVVSAEFEEFLAAFEEEKLSEGRRRVGRNGHLPERRILTWIGAVEARVRKAHNRSGAMEPFRSSLVPLYVGRSARVDAAVSTGQMRALGALVGTEDREHYGVRRRAPPSMAATRRATTWRRSRHSACSTLCSPRRAA